MAKRYPIYVSDHALLRYIERHYGVSMNQMRDELLTIVTPAISAGAATLSWRDVTFAFQRQTDGQMHVATTLHRNMKRQRIPQKKSPQEKNHG